MSNRHILYSFRFTAKVQQGVWHTQDNYEVTGYGPVEEQVHYIVAPNEILARAVWEERIKYWPKECVTTLIEMKNMGDVTVVDFI